MAVIYVKDTSRLPARNDADFYPTPMGFCRAALAQLPDGLTPTCILDPGAGTGVWGRAARERYPGVTITGIDLRAVPKPAGYTFWINADFLRAATPQPAFDLVIGNPPFNVAEAFIRASLDLLEDGGVLMFLLRLAFLEGQARGSGLWSKTPPERVVVASRRIAFTGGSNPNSYALYIWRKGYTGDTRLGWMTHDDNDMESAQPTATRQMAMFAEEVA